jgi:two-component system sensor histidine kinase MprB
MSLRSRLTLVAAGAVAVSIALVSLVVFYAERRDLQLVADADLRRHATVIAERLLASGEVDPDDIPVLFGDGGLSAAQVVSPAGAVIPLTADGITLAADDAVLGVASGNADRFYATADTQAGRLRVLTIPLGDGALQVAQSLRLIDRHLVHIAGLLALVTFGGLGVAVLFGRVVAGAALRPIAKLTAGAEEVAVTRDLRSRLHVSGHDELGRLAGSLNTMLEALNTSQQSQRRLVADASHELRTPLASLLTNIEVLERADQLHPDERTRVVEDLRSEIEGLVSTVHDLLDLARDDPGDRELVDVSLDAVIARSVAWVRKRVPDVHFETSLEAVTVRAEEAAVQRAVGNLLDNAAKWAPPGTTIEVRLDADGLSVRDHGPGIDADDLPRVFERFYRSPAARGRPGAGLGLAIVRQVADAHHWEARAENAEGGGTRFTVRFRPTGSVSSPILKRRSAAPQVRGANSRDTEGEPPTTEGPPRERVHVPLTKVWLGAAAVPLILALGVSLVGDEASRTLKTMTGTLERCDQQYCVGDTVVDFGAAWYLEAAAAAHDFDGDGDRGLLIEELDGLLGQRVTLETDDGPLDADVFTVNGLPLRNANGELPPPGETPESTVATPPARPSGRLLHLTGVLTRCDERFCVDETVVDFGPVWYVQRTPAAHDFDLDGDVGTVAEEIEGLVGAQVDVTALLGSDDADVISLNGMAYRDERAPPPWSGGPLRDR